MIGYSVTDCFQFDLVVALFTTTSPLLQTVVSSWGLQTLLRISVRNSEYQPVLDGSCMLLIVHACYCGPLFVLRSHSPFIWTQIHYWIHRLVFELKPVPCYSDQSVLGSSSDFLSVIRRALPNFMCFVPSRGPTCLRLGNVLYALRGIFMCDVLTRVPEFQKS